MAKFKPSAQLRLGTIDDYYPYSLRQAYTTKELRREYSRLRAIANKRLKGLKKSEFGNTAIVLQYSEGFEPLAEVEDVSRALTEVARFITSKLSTVTGQRQYQKASLETLHRHGFDFVTAENLQDFGEYMEIMRGAFAHKLYDSKRIAEYFSEIKAIQDRNEAQLKQGFFDYIAER